MKGLANIIAFALFWALLSAVSFGTAIVPLLLYLWWLRSGGDARAGQAPRLLAGTLMPGEEIVAEGVQRRVFALMKRRLLLAITSSRIIGVRRGLIGGFTMQDIQWKDLTDARIEQNVWASLCGSNLVFEHANPSVPPMAIDGIDSPTASTIYARAQFEEQAWEEKRRVRSMEETRAASGRVVIHAPTAPPAPTAASATAPVSTVNRMLEQIGKAKELLDAGAVSDAEFQEMKAKIISAG